MSYGNPYNWDNQIELTDHWIPPQFRPDAQFFAVDGNILWEDVYTSQQYMRAYEKCAPLSSIINHKAKAYAGGELQILNASTGNEVRGAYKDWYRLFDQPNEFQSGRQFLDEMYTFRAINGWTLVQKTYAVGFPDVPAKMVNIPFWFLRFDRYFNKPQYQLSKEDVLSNIYYCYNGVETKLDPKDLILITDDTGIYDPLTWLPRSRIALLQEPITTCVSAAEAEITLIQKRGALGMFTNRAADAVGTLAMKQKDKEDLHQQFNQMHGMSRNKFPFAISNANLEWQSTTFPTSELLLQESYVKAVKGMCEGYEYYFELLAYSDRKNLANVNSFDRMLVQNYIIPDAQSIDAQLMIGLNARQQNIIIQHNYSQMPALQQSEKDKGEGMKAVDDAKQIEWDAGLITRNDWRECHDMDRITNNPEFDKYKFEITVEEPNNNGTTQQNTGITP